MIYLILEAMVLTIIVLIYLYFSKNPRFRPHRKIILGDYILDKPIGQGGMAEIYLGHQRGEDKLLAVKVLQSKCSKDDENIQRFMKEGKNLKAIKEKYPQCPVVKVHDYGRENTTGRYMIIMDYLPGENLKDLLLAKTIKDINIKIHIIKEVAKALQASHALKIYHRDVSPENIIVNEHDKKVTLIDFGIAKELTSDYETGSGVVMGKLNYIAPEQFKGSKATAKSDIYALGAVSFYLFEGAPLYNSKNPYELMNMHLTFPVPQMKARIPGGLKEFIRRMLDKDPAIRPYANEVAEKMRFFLGQDGGSKSLSGYESMAMN